MVNAAAQPKSHGKLVFILLALVACIATATIYFIMHRATVVADVKIDGIYLPAAVDINDFKLKDTRGKVFTRESLKGHWTFMFFGFTNCGMVCPTTMAALKQMYHTLKTQMPAGQLPEVVMVSVDPERDSIKRMKEYVTTFNPNFIGARAEMPVILSLQKQLHLISVKMQADGKRNDQYTINHSAEIMVFNPEGRLQAYLAFPHEPAQLVADYKTLLNTQPSVAKV